MPLPYGEAFLHPRSHSPPTSNKTGNWGPYANAGEFGASMLIILVTLFSSLILALALVAVLRFLLCGRRHPPPRAPVNDSDKQVGTAAVSVAEFLPTLVFSAGTKLASAEPVCAICLSEFAEGDVVRVLPACNHGFHVKCIEGWLASRCTCPTCRSSF